VGSENGLRLSEDASESDSLKKRPNAVYADEEPADDDEDCSKQNIIVDEEDFYQ